MMLIPWILASAEGGGEIKRSSNFNDLGDFGGARRYPYGEYGERREGMRAVKMQKPGMA